MTDFREDTHEHFSSQKNREFLGQMELLNSYLSIISLKRRPCTSEFVC
jgi:hypothetical protein